MKSINSKSFVLRLFVAAFSLGLMTTAHASLDNAASFAEGNKIVFNADPIRQNLTVKSNNLTNVVYNSCMMNHSKETDKAMTDRACQILAVSALSSMSLCAIYNNPGQLSNEITDQCYSDNYIKWIKRAN
ncbi:hypothetical protein ACPUEX_22510 [Enterobacter vonholyi]